MQEFNFKQINNLLTGVILACELPTHDEINRRFITIHSFEYHSNGELLCWNKKIKSQQEGNNALFRIHVYTVPSEYIAKDYDINEACLTENKLIEVIGWQELYANILIYIKNLNKFVPQWHCDNPLE
ncbi:MAG: hypothetical protein K2G88_09125 [Oscillospiraceae bacterium]|nr:hypothetical protein [Oscillospiraceae bacterium]